MSCRQPVAVLVGHRQQAIGAPEAQRLAPVVVVVEPVDPETTGNLDLLAVALDDQGHGVAFLGALVGPVAILSVVANGIA